MLHLNLRLSNPFVEEGSTHSKDFDWSISKNVNLAVELTGLDFRDIFSFTLWVRDSQNDHRGVLFEVSLFGIGIMLELYDVRHQEDYK